MKTDRSKGESPLHQTVTGGLKFKSGGKSIAVEFTGQQLNGHAGTATFWAWLHGKGWRERLAAARPHRLPTSNNSLTPQEKAPAFVHGLLSEARTRTLVACFRRDPLVPELLGIRRVARESTWSRFLAGFGTAVLLAL
jgi:hypothetical protein